jgi:hypothetical protein
VVLVGFFFFWGGVSFNLLLVTKCGWGRKKAGEIGLKVKIGPSAWLPEPIQSP